MYESKLGDYIRVYKNYFDIDFCESVVRDISREPWEKHAYYNNLTKQLRTYTNDLSISYSDIEGKSVIDNEMSNVFKKYINYERASVFFQFKILGYAGCFTCFMAATPLHTYVRIIHIVYAEIFFYKTRFIHAYE